MMPRELLITTASEWNIPLSPVQINQFERYGDELTRWNEHTNLTSITGGEAIVVRHFLDSLTLAQVWPDQPPRSLADIGTGAGFPGLPLKIIWPDLRLLLVESVGKKTEFLRHIVDRLQLIDVEICAARAEEIGRDHRYREQFEGVTARAVATLSVLAEYCLPLCRVGGVFVAPKGAEGAAEAEAAKPAFEALGGRLKQILPVQLSSVEERTLVVVDKTHPTPPRYPRRVGIPLKRPL